MRKRFAAICAGIMLLNVATPASTHVQKEYRIVAFALALTMQAANKNWVETGEWIKGQRGSLQASMSRDEMLDLFTTVIQRVQNGMKPTTKVDNGIGKFAEYLGKWERK